MARVTCHRVPYCVSVAGANTRMIEHPLSSATAHQLEIFTVLSWFQNGGWYGIYTASRDRLNIGNGT